MWRLALPAALFALVACSSASVSGDAPALRGNSPAQSDSARSALGAMQTRDYKVTWLVGDRLRVENPQGNVIADGVAVEDLQRIDPFLYYACAKAIGRLQPDARFDPGLDETGRRRSPLR